MAKENSVVVTMDPFGNVSQTEIPAGLQGRIEAAMREVQSRGSMIEDDDCPICQAMREGGLEVPDHSAPQPRNRAERRLWKSIERRMRRKS